MRDCMIDIETLGTATSAPVLTIGACFFDIETGEIGQKFHEKIDAADALNYSRMSGDTFKWWMQQSDPARAKVIAGSRPSHEVFLDFHAFVASHDVKQVRPWGNGASFDISILEFSFERILGARHPADRRDAPWKFWNVRDCRTIKDLGEAAGYSFDMNKRKGTHHDALDDAIFQAEWTSFYWHHLTAQPNAAAQPPQAATPPVDASCFDLLG